MNIHDLREAQVRFENRQEEIIYEREELYKLRTSFVKYFNPDRIRMMKIDEYAIGVKLPEKGLNFCYAIERQLDGLGRIIGATAFKFGVYFGRTKSEEDDKYRFTHKFGDTYQDAFKNVKDALLNLLVAGEKEDLNMIVDNILSPMFKGKILSIYFPDRYLNIFSSEHLDYFLTFLDLDSEELINGDAVYKREALIKFKNQDRIMKDWSIDLFSHFLYTEYPLRPPKSKNAERVSSDPLEDYRTPIFHSNPAPSFVNLKIIAPTVTVDNTNKPKVIISNENPNYEQEARRLKKLGDRGEKIVLELEKKRLVTAGRRDLAKKVKRISLDSDAIGYDILSFDIDGTKRLIEVKATRSKVGSAHFFCTANELKTALQSVNYYIYIVYDVTSKYPKVWALSNPFKPENKNIIKTPVNYRVTVNTKE